MPIPKALAEIAAAMLIAAALTGCTAGDAQPVSASSTPFASPSPSQTSNDPRWGTGSAPKLDDYFVADAPFVDPDGNATTGDLSPRDAHDPKEPVPIAQNGNIFVQFKFWTGEVDRAITDSYISADKAGKGVGPKILCAKSPSGIRQQFDCSVQFKDREFKSGVYYGVFKSKPTQASQQAYGTLSKIIPFYTEKWQ